MESSAGPTKHISAVSLDSNEAAQSAENRSSEQPTPVLQAEQEAEQQQQAEQEEHRNAAKSTAMDDSIWCNLPEHIMDLVLAWLPVSSLMRFRSVCKRWNCVVNYRPFHDLCARVQDRGPYFLMFADHFHRRVAAVYDQEMSAWRLFDFSCFMRCRFPESFLVLASAGGLLCLEGTGSQSGNLFISNPITRLWRKLPPMIPMRAPYVVGMVMFQQQQQQQQQQHRSWYKILVAQDGDDLASQVYDSRTNCWKLGGVLHRRTAILAGATFYKGLLYCLTFSPNGILAFDLEADQWHPVENIPLPPSITCPNLMTHRGKLLLIAGVEELGTLQSVRIWELNSTCSEQRQQEQQQEHKEKNESLASRPAVQWLELIKLPDDVFKRLFSSSSGHFICIGHGNYVVLHEYYSPEILVLHLVDKSWHWLPSVALNQHIEARSVLGYAFQPRVEARP